MGPSETNDVREFDLSITDRRLNLDPPVISVQTGDQVVLRIQSDEELRFHIHQYDHEIMLMPGEVKELSFPAMFSGRFAIELHTKGQEDMDMPKDMDMNVDLSNAQISIASVSVMENMVTVTVDIEGIELGSEVHWHIKLDEPIKEKQDHTAVMIFDGMSHMFHGIPKGEHAVYVGLVNSEHELVGDVASQKFIIETELDMNAGMNMRDDEGHGRGDNEPILVGFLEVNPKA